MVDRSRLRIVFIPHHNIHIMMMMIRKKRCWLLNNWSWPPRQPGCRRPANRRPKNAPAGKMHLAIVAHGNKCAMKLTLTVESRWNSAGYSLLILSATAKASANWLAPPWENILDYSCEKYFSIVLQIIFTNAWVLFDALKDLKCNSEIDGCLADQESTN